ncbi:MAG: hypothetical protein SVP26_10145 [Chloroflexota bacterium]|nr:hypothetical protein [Chloroflexota bacterium]
MRVRLTIAVLVGAVAVSLWLSGVASAEETETVKPVVYVVAEYAGSLGMDGDIDEQGVMELGFVTPGGEAATKTLNLNVGANADWRLMVTTTQDLTVGGGGVSIPADAFTFTSSGCDGATYVESDTPFRTSGDSAGEQVTVDVVTGGPQTDGCGVDVVYRLEVPAAQPEGYYSAGDHVYTLVVGD